MFVCCIYCQVNELELETSGTIWWLLQHVWLSYRPEAFFVSLEFPSQGRTLHSSKVANEPPAKNQPAFFFSFCLLPPRLVFLQMNRKRMSLTGVLLQHSNWNCDLEVAGELQRVRTGWVGSGSGHRYRDRQRVWTWWTRHSGSCRRSDVVQCRESRLERRLSKRKEQFSSAWAVDCRSFRPSFLKTFTVWRPASRRCQSRVTDQSEALGKRRGRLGICRTRQILVSGRTSKSL